MFGKKITDFDEKGPDLSAFVTTIVLNTKFKEVNNKISNFSGLVKKTDYDVKISEIDGKYFRLL